MPILCLEASTSSAKAMLWEPEQGIIGVEQWPYPLGVCDGITFEPERVVEVVLACGVALLSKHKGIRVEAIGLSSIWHSLVVLDSQRKPIGPGRTWADTSPAPTVAAYREDEEFSAHFYHKTGCAMHSGCNIWKWMHLRRVADISGVRYVSCLPEYMFYMLTGELAISQSVAAGSGFLDAYTLCWDPDLLGLAGIAEGMLGRLVEPHYTLPLARTAADALGLPTGLPVVVTGPDGALNHIAAGGIGSSAITLSIGTSGALRVAHQGPAIPQRQSTWCYYGAEGRYIVGAATSGAGNCVNWFAKNILVGNVDLVDLEAAAVSANASCVPYFLPFLFGERSPGWVDAQHGGFFGLSGSAGLGDVYRSVLEGVLFNLYQNYRILVQYTDLASSRIGISGGITHSQYWTQLAADVFGLPLEENTGEHASLLGAAYLAAKATGVISMLSSIPEARGKRHMPDAAQHALEMERFDKWLEIYEKIATA